MEIGLEDLRPEIEGPVAGSESLTPFGAYHSIASTESTSYVYHSLGGRSCCFPLSPFPGGFFPFSSETNAKSKSLRFGVVLLKQSLPTTIDYKTIDDDLANLYRVPA